MVRSFRAVPLGSFAMAPITTLAIVRAAGGIFLAAVELAAPVLAATLLVEIAVALLGKLSPQLPVMSLTVPLKTLTGFAVLIGSLALWPRFIEARFHGLLDLAERLIRACDRSRREDSRCRESAPNRLHRIAAKRPAKKATCCTAANFRRGRHAGGRAGSGIFRSRECWTAFAQFLGRSRSRRSRRWEPSTLEPTLLALRRLTLMRSAPGRHRAWPPWPRPRWLGMLQTGGVTSMPVRSDFDWTASTRFRNVKNLFSLRAAARLGKSLLPARCWPSLPCNGLRGN